MTNAVELIGHYGSDETVALSAWTSTARELTDDKRQRIDKLLIMLADNHHETPFEKSFLHFLVRCETASHIHLLKHRIGVSINAESARYKELQAPTFYTPLDWSDESREQARHVFDWALNAYRDIAERETERLGRKRAKETARFVLPYANQLTLDVSWNLRSFLHFYFLRGKDDAQDEIHWIADQMLEQIRRIPGAPFKLSLQAFGLWD